MRARFLIILAFSISLLGADKCGVPELFSLKSTLDYERPEFSESLDSEDGHFRIWYTTDGPHAIDPTDISPSDGIPDWAQNAGEYLERAYALLIDSLGARSPIPDSSGFPGISNVGGDDRIDLYFVDMSTFYGNVYYGMTMPDTCHADGRCSAFITIENDFQAGDFPNYIGRENEALAVTCAHEFFHTIHFAYGYNAAWLWWMEATAVWSEERNFDSVNDYIAYLPLFQNHPELGLDNNNPNGRIYGTCLFPIYISSIYGDSAIIDIWERIPGTTVFSALSDWADSIGVELNSLYGDFARWNLFVGDYARPWGYSDAVLMPEPAHIEPFDCPDTLSGTGAALYVDLSADDTGGIWARVGEIDDVSAVMFGIPQNGTDTPDTSVDVFIFEDTIAGVWRYQKLTVAISHLGRYSTDRAWFEPIVYGPAPNARVVIPSDDLDAQPYPNPFVYNTHHALYFPFDANEDTPIRFSVWSSSAELVYDFSGNVNRGFHRTPEGAFGWYPSNSNGEILASGVYLYWIAIENDDYRGKFAIIRE